MMDAVKAKLVENLKNAVLYEYIMAKISDDDKKILDDRFMWFLDTGGYCHISEWLPSQVRVVLDEPR